MCVIQRLEHVERHDITDRPVEPKDQRAAWRRFPLQRESAARLRETTPDFPDT
jgi:hypothetical protein